MPTACDVCVIGAGFAGLTLARRLYKSGLKIWLVESGGHHPTDFARQLNAGQSHLEDYPFCTSRARVFGGTSTLWYGACMRLDPIDFETRDWLPNSGWPITSETLAGYADEAKSYLEISECNAFQHQLEASPFHSGDLCALPVFYSRSRDLRTRYRSLIKASPDVHCLLNATATELLPSDTEKEVRDVKLSVVGWPDLILRPRVVVLAGGGIENARLLLASNTSHPKGLGNANDVVGRYHMEHPIRTVGILPIGDRQKSLLRFTNRSKLDRYQGQGTFGLSEDTRRREKLLNMHIRCYRYHPLENTPQAVALKRAAADRASIGHRAGQAIAAAHPSNLRYLTWHTKNKLLRNARFDHLRMMAFVEHEPDAENRISIGRGKDAFGQPLPDLCYEESSLLRDSVKRSMNVMAAALAQKGFPGLCFGDDLPPALHDYDAYGLHHMGATRMSDDPRLGVVDANCKVHGISNLFVAGSSVFPTAGAANPTWTITALALRLADEVRHRFCQGQFK